MFKNPEYNSIKVLLLVAVVVGAGFFIWKNFGNQGNTARVIETDSFVVVKANGASGVVAVPFGSIPTITWTSSRSAYCEVGPSNTTGAFWPIMSSGGSPGGPASGGPNNSNIPGWYLPLRGSGVPSAQSNITAPQTFAIRCNANTKGTGKWSPEATVQVVPAAPLTATVTVMAYGQTGSVSVKKGDMPAISWSSSSAVSCEIGPSNTNTGIQGESAFWNAKNGPTDKPGTVISNKGSFSSSYPLMATATYAAVCKNAAGQTGPESTVQILVK